jgi:hypothetical protein
MSVKEMKKTVVIFCLVLSCKSKLMAQEIILHNNGIVGLQVNDILLPDKELKLTFENIKNHPSTKDRNYFGIANSNGFTYYYLVSDSSMFIKNAGLVKDVFFALNNQQVIKGIFIAIEHAESDKVKEVISAVFGQIMVSATSGIGLNTAYSTTKSMWKKDGVTTFFIEPLYSEISELSIIEMQQFGSYPAIGLKSFYK